MLEGFKEFGKDKNDVLFLLLAAGSLENEVRRFISRSSMEDKFILAGRVPNNKLPAYLNAADVYISTSNSDGTSLALLEAMACGLGLIISDVPAIKEWVSEENGLVVPRKNSREVYLALEKYYREKDLREKHGANNLRIASERADWNKNYSLLKSIYNELVK